METAPAWPGALNLYLHVPFCRSKCAYCSFNSYPGLDGLIPSYVKALLKEMANWAASGLLPERLESAYFGGGTPSLLSPEETSALLEACRTPFQTSEETETSLEANPGTVDLAYLQGLRRLGVNRLSLGVQSFQEGELRLLGRLHNVAQAREAVLLARRAGFDNLNLDLIYGLPLQSLPPWRHSLEEALALSPEHLSLYCLSLEEGTPLAETVARGELPQPDPDLAAEMYLLAEELLKEAGYEHYEISNWARPGRRCRHNLNCWHNRSYLGLGAGAHSYIRPYRWANAPSPQEYISRMHLLSPAGPPQASSVLEKAQALSPLASWEEIGPALERAETVILGLRLHEGVDLSGFRQRFGQDLQELYGEEIAELSEAGLVVLEEKALRLTPRGRLLGNQVFVRLLPVRG